MSKYYFDDVYADKASQLLDEPCSLADNDKVAACRVKLDDSNDWLALGDALCTQMRCREAIDAYTKAVELSPTEIRGYRGRGGRYLAIGQPEKAKSDLLHCEQMGGEPLDLHYRIGLCEYLLGHYEAAIDRYEKARPLCEDEMGIAVIYWHTLSCYRIGKPLTMLDQYHKGMEVGHHTAYEKAMQFCNDLITETEFLTQLESETDDMEYVIALYGYCIRLQHIGRMEEYQEMLNQLIARDKYWFCFSYLAAWSDSQKL